MEREDYISTSQEAAPRSPRLSSPTPQRGRLPWVPLLMPFHLIKPLILPGARSSTFIAHFGSFLLYGPHPPAQTHENTQVFMGRLLAVNGANYMVQAPRCNSRDMTFPQAPGALGEVLSTEGRGQVGVWLRDLQQEPAACNQARGDLENHLNDQQVHFSLRCLRC